MYYVRELGNFNNYNIRQIRSVKTQVQYSSKVLFYFVYSRRHQARQAYKKKKDNLIATAWILVICMQTASSYPCFKDITEKICCLTHSIWLSVLQLQTGENNQVPAAVILCIIQCFHMLHFLRKSQKLRYSRKPFTMSFMPKEATGSAKLNLGSSLFANNNSYHYPTLFYCVIDIFLLEIGSNKEPEKVRSWTAMVS